MGKEFDASERMDKEISGWSGNKTPGQDAPRMTEPKMQPAAFSPARRMVSPAEAEAMAAAQRNAPRVVRPRPNYKLPE